MNWPKKTDEAPSLARKGNENFPTHYVGVALINYYSAEEVIQIAAMYLDMQVIDKVVIVDNGSSPAEKNMLAEFASKNANIELRPQKANLGYARGNNKAIERLAELGCSEIVISNNDILIKEQDVDRILDVLRESDEFEALAPAMLDQNRNKVPLRFIKLGYLRIFLRCFLPEQLIDKKTEFLIPDRNDEITEQSFLPGSFFVTKRLNFDESGLFDEGTFLYREEEILGCRFDKAGKKLGVVNGIEFVHNHCYKKASVESVKTMLKHSFNSEALFFKKYKKANMIQSAYVRVLQKVYWFVQVNKTRIKSWLSRSEL